ncbi:uncharacterized protein DS421_20g704480 [Arachis hypogaea]|nr:uncharacterized protein DS421_20g704480 [Arachis hypogaea]
MYSSSLAVLSCAVSWMSSELRLLPHQPHCPVDRPDINCHRRLLPKVALITYLQARCIAPPFPRTVVAIR